MPARSRNLKRLAILGLGWTFVVLGVAGLFLPFLQGILFLLVGLFLLSRESARARLVMQRLRRRYPKLGDKVDEAGAWLQRRRRQLFGNR